MGGLSTRKKSVEDLTRDCVLQEETAAMIIDAWSAANLVTVNISVGKRIRAIMEIGLGMLLQPRLVVMGVMGVQQ